jgi:GTP-binding protein Era
MENNNSKTVFVTICGRPNVGKSTILNAFLGKKISIVSPKAQTTRVRVTGVLTRDNCQYVFLDTPGMHKAKSGLGQAMVQAVSEGIENADITLFVVEAGDKIMAAERSILKMLSTNKMRAFLIINKTDSASKEEIVSTIAQFSQCYDFEEIIPVSAKTRDGLDIVLQELYKRAEDSFFYYDSDFVSDMPGANYVCEVIREKMLYNLGLEIPHTVALVAESFEESDTLARCSVTIYCTRESHKGIIIGKKGAMLKKINTEARCDLEKYFGKKVFIECFVKVKNDWQNSSAMLRMLGL